MILAPSSLLASPITPTDIALLSGGLTAIVGLFVAVQAYRGFRRNGAPRMRALAIGIGLLTTGAFLAAVVADTLGAGDGVVLLVRGGLSVAGLSAVLYALVME